jgi:heat shock protein HslJ
MNRRTFLRITVASGAIPALAPGARVLAQEATPQVAAEGLLLVRWELERITYGDGSVVEPDDPAKYAIQFLPDGQVAIQADCNVGGGEYTVDGTNLTFGPLRTTLVLCEPGSIGDEFFVNLDSVVSFARASDASDMLTLAMEPDGGTMSFRPGLTGVVWEWTEFQGSDDSVVAAADPSLYTIEFLADGQVQVLADCNRGIGSATFNGNEIDLSIGTTRMLCPPESQSGEFLLLLELAVSWVIRDGQLALSLPADAGIALFRATMPSEEEETPVAGG